MPSKMLRRALREPAIRWFVIGSFLSNVGTWIQRVTIGWLVFDLTNSAAWVGAVAACEIVPSILVAPFGGVLVDRSNRGRLFAGGQICAQLQAIALVGFAFSEHLNLAVIIGASMALGTIDGINQPTRLAIISDVAPREFIRPAVSLTSLGFNVARFIGPMTAGAALATGGPVLAFGLNALSFTPFVFMIFLIRMQPAPPVLTERPTIRAGMLEGLRYTTRHALLGPIFLMLVTVSLLARSFLELLPAISGLWFDTSPETLASLTSAVGLGAIGGGYWILGRRDLRGVLTASISLPGALVTILALFAVTGRVEWMAYPLLAAAGFCVVACGVGIQSLIHLTVDPAFRGRVLSLYGLVQRALPAVGALFMGVLTDIVGLRTPLLVAAAIAGAVWFVIWRKRHLLAQTLPVE